MTPSGVALLAGVPGVTGVWIPAAALAVVGGGLLVGGVRRGGRGLIGVAAVLLVATVLGSVAVTRPVTFGAPDATAPVQDVGDVAGAPTSPALVAPQYRSGLGDIDLDLSGLAVPAGAPPVRTTVETGAGDVAVRVPATADVTLTCSSGIGDVDCLGVTSDVTGRVDLGPDGPGGPVVDLTVRSGAGDLAVSRG